jgi:hypothetical protein
VEPVDLHVLADEPHGFLPLQKPTSPLSLSSPTGSSSQMTTSRLGASASRRIGSTPGARGDGSPFPAAHQSQHRRRSTGQRLKKNQDM